MIQTQAVYMEYEPMAWTLAKFSDIFILSLWVIVHKGVQPEQNYQ